MKQNPLFLFGPVCLAILIVAIVMRVLPEFEEATLKKLIDIGIIALTPVGIYFLYWRNLSFDRQATAAEENLKQAEKRTVTDNFVKAIELLGATTTTKDEDGKDVVVPALEQRLGAIYALEKIAQENVDTYHITIMETLCAYVREHRNKIPIVEWPGAVFDRLKDDMTGDQISEHEDFKNAVADTDITVADLQSDRKACLEKWKQAHPPKLLAEDRRAILDVIARRKPKQREHEKKEGYRPDFSRTNFQFIEYHGTAFERANLSFVRMEGANLSFVRMEGADLSGARMERAVLGWAQMAGADLRWAQMEGADLRFARITGANLSLAQMEATVLLGARMEGANLSYSRLIGTDDGPRLLRLTNLSASTHNGGALRFVDLSRAIFDDWTDFRNSFGDGSVILPDGMPRPCQWSGQTLPDDQFWGRWRGWLEHPSRPDQYPSWEWLAPAGFEDVTPIPPPEGCVWQTGPLPGADGG